MDRSIETDWDVAICGAGPVGLLLAAELATRGVRVIVLERAEEASALPKANGVVGRTAVDLRQRGYLKGTRLRVVSPPRFPFGPLTLRLGFGPGNPLHILPIPQRRLEELFESRALEGGAEVRRGAEVRGFTQGGAAVELDVRSGESVRSIRAQYLVGCDGARSVIRKRAGIAFPGFTSDEIARIGRVTIPDGSIARVADGFEIPGVGPVAAMRPNRMSGGGFSIAPVAALDRSAPADLYLVSTHEPRGTAEPSETISSEELRESIRRVLGADLPFTEATALRSTVGNSRQADSYRSGRVFLAGDAAHIFNAGGSSLNIGLQDALDLARRLAAVLRDGAPVDELAGYEATRRPAGERALQHTRAQAALGRDDEASLAIRGLVGDLVSKRATAHRLARLIEAA